MSRLLYGAGAMDIVLDVVVGLGSNLGDRLFQLSGAVRSLAADPRASGLTLSDLYETEPVGPPQPDYLNAAVRLCFRGSAAELLALLLDVERRFGRVRAERFGPRTLDLDVLWIAGTSIRSPELTVPHARLRERRFALQPLLDVAPDAADPDTGAPLADALHRLPAGGVRKVTAAEWARVDATTARW